MNEEIEKINQKIEDGEKQLRRLKHEGKSCRTGRSN